VSHLIYLKENKDPYIHKHQASNKCSQIFALLLMFSWCPFSLLDNTVLNGCQWSKQLETLGDGFFLLLLLVLRFEIQSDKCEIYIYVALFLFVLQFCACSTACLQGPSSVACMTKMVGLRTCCACDGQNSVLERGCTVQFSVTRAGPAFPFQTSLERRVFLCLQR